jgi:hypothetical protein
MKISRRQLRQIIKEAMLDPKVFAKDEIPKNMLAGDPEMRQKISDFSKTDYLAAKELADSLDMIPGAVASAGGYGGLQRKGKKTNKAMKKADNLVRRLDYQTRAVAKSQAKQRYNDDFGSSETNRADAYQPIYDLLNDLKKEAQDGVDPEILFDDFLAAADQHMATIWKGSPSMKKELYDLYNKMAEDFVHIGSKYEDDPDERTKRRQRMRMEHERLLYAKWNPKYPMHDFTDDLDRIYGRKKK